MVDVEPIELTETIEKNGTSASLISALEEIQGRYHYLPQGAMILVSERLGVPITSQDPELRARLDPEEAGQRLANFIKATAEELKILTMLSGHDAVKDSSEEDLRAMDPNTAGITGLKLIGYERKLPRWENGH